MMIGDDWVKLFPNSVQFLTVISEKKYGEKSW